MITSIEAKVEANGALDATLYLEGDRRDLLGKLRKPGVFAAAEQIISGLTAQLETVITFTEMPGRRGVKDIHELIVDNGANEYAQKEWQTRVYPRVNQRLAGFGQ